MSEEGSISSIISSYLSSSCTSLINH